MLSLVTDNLSQTGPVWWVPLAIWVVGVAAAVSLLDRAGPRRSPRWRRWADALARLTGLPAWCAGAIAVALAALTVALVGFMWDVAWHADLGRDKALFTPPHTMILTGLAGIAAAAALSVALATADRARVGVAVGRWRIPWSALPMGIMGAGALVGFPLDDYWHAVYGIDVTMWSPTHLLMIGGASLTPIAAWLMLAEAGAPATRTRAARLISEALAGSTLIGLSTFQLEFDLGIPQWQALYHPVLIALAMGVGLVAAREAGGRGQAVLATLRFIVARGLVALIVGPIFGLSLERFPLYLGGALVVEAVYALTPRMRTATRAALTGLLLGTVGMLPEWGWTHLWSPQPWQPRLLGAWWVVVAMAVVASFLGAALGLAVSHRQTLSAAGVAGAFLVLVGLLAVPFPRTGLAATATVSATRVGPAVPALTREGVATVEQDMTVSVRVSPGGAADGADVFRVFTWQGGSLIISPLRAAGGGRFTIDAPVPSGGSWKSIVFLEKGSVVAAVPVSFPPDPQYNLAAIPVPTTARTLPFVAATHYLTRESHGGSALPAVLAYTALGVVFSAWCVAVVGVGEAMRRRRTVRVPLPAALGG